MSKYRLKIKYPTLPLDWEVGMEVVFSKHNTANYFPINVNYTKTGIRISDLQNNPLLWEIVVDKDYSIESFVGVTSEIATKDCDGNFAYKGANSWSEEEMLIPAESGFPIIHSVKRLSDNVIFTLGDICAPIDNPENKRYITVIEFCEAGYLRVGSNNYYTGINDLQHFVEKEQEFEVLKYKQKDTNTFSKVRRGGVEHDKSWEMFSINRLSDNITFNVGDTVRNPKLQNKQWFTITGFAMDCLDEHLLVLGGNGAIGIRKIEHYNAPLFTTEDGVEIFVNDEYLVLFTRDNSIYGKYNAFKGMKHNPWLYPHLNFSTREKAEEYIKLNKVQYSMQDILNASETETEILLCFLEQYKIVNLDKLPK